jgi:hypothetical protein
MKNRIKCNSICTHSCFYQKSSHSVFHWKVSRMEISDIKGWGRVQDRIFINNILWRKIECLVYFRVLIPNIVFLFHKNKLLRTKIAKYFVCFIKTAFLFRSGSDQRAHSETKQSMTTYTKSVLRKCRLKVDVYLGGPARKHPSLI